MNSMLQAVMKHVLTTGTSMQVFINFIVSLLLGITIKTCFTKSCIINAFPGCEAEASRRRDKLHLETAL